VPGLARSAARRRAIGNGGYPIGGGAARCAGGGAAGGGGPGDPFAFATGYGALGLEGAYRDRPVLAKPFLREHLVALMAKACGE